MGEAIPYIIVTEILKKLGSAALQEFGLVCGVNGSLHKLRNTVSTIRAVLIDAEEQKATNREVSDWLRKLNDALHDADDLIDDLATEGLRREAMTRNKWAKKVRIFFSASNQIAFSLTMGHRIKAIRERIDEIAEDRNKFNLAGRSLDARAEYRKREETHSFVRTDDVVGRDDDRLAIAERLLDSDGVEDVSVVPIVGIGGVGKTTLAQLVYNDEIVTRHFEIKLWVCASDVFDVKLIAEKIIESATGRRPKSLSMDKLQEKLKSEIDGKRYLLVLDDLWNEDRNAWLNLRDLLMDGGRGSKILLTTRSQLAARITGAISPYLLECLSENESWSLFKQMAFRKGEESHNPRLVTIGKEIVEKCQGVPLAIRALGSLLYSKDTEKEWLNFKEKDIPKIAQEENVILPILKLSFDYLPWHLKRCFAFCSFYPKDHVIDKQELIQLWIAHGYVQPVDENQQLEDAADSYFMDLLRRSFFQDPDRDKLGGITSCKMHGLIHDLAKLVAETQSFMVNLDAKDVTERIQLGSFDPSVYASSWKVQSSLLRANKIRTFLLPVQDLKQHITPVSSVYETIVSTFRWLRVLDMHNLGITEVPGCISKLKHLRYLDLSNNGIVTLPSSITNLQNLQTLKLSSCFILKELPRDTKKLVSLRHLELDGCESLAHMPRGFGQLTSLRTLKLFVLDPDGDISRLNGGLSELRDLNKLCGELMIKGLGRRLKRKSAECSKEENYLKGKEHLDSLQLCWADDHNNESELVLRTVQPHPNLKELSIRGYGGINFPNWMTANICLSIPNIVRITMQGCHGCMHLPRLSQLPFLQALHLDNLGSVGYIDSGGGVDGKLLSSFHSSPQGGEPTFTFFPSLKTLELRDLPNLKGWWRSEAEEQTATAFAPAQNQQQLLLLSEMPSFPCLSELKIINCPELASMPRHLCPEVELDGVNEKLVKQQLMKIPLTAAKTLFSWSSSSLVSRPKHLYLRRIDELVTLPKDAYQSLSTLRFLEISFCRRLTTLFREMQHLVALEKLEINDCPELDFSCDDGCEQFQGLKNLTSLVFVKIPKMECLPPGLQHATTLHSLEIYCCENLKTLPEWISNLKSLKQLSISQCSKLASVPQGMGHLTALEKLGIFNCQELDFPGDGNDGGRHFQGLSSLNSLDFTKIPKLVSLPLWLQHVTSLQSLKIDKCENFMTLPEWVDKFTSLQQLLICDCPKLTYLPEGLHRLTALQELKLFECSPVLYNRCQEGTGEDWPKIAHIPKFYIFVRFFSSF